MVDPFRAEVAKPMCEPQEITAIIIKETDKYTEIRSQLPRLTAENVINAHSFVVVNCGMMNGGAKGKCYESCY